MSGSSSEAGRTGVKSSAKQVGRARPKKSRTRKASNAAPAKPKLVDVGLRALRSLQAGVREQFLKLRKDIAKGASGLRTVRLDTQVVRPSRYCCRPESAYDTADFHALVSLINRSQGNVQAILVRPIAASRYEIVFGHRRHRACQLLGIPVLAAVWDTPLSDTQVFEINQFENRGQQRLSAYDQGRLFAAALEQGLYSSHRQLAEAIAVTHTWVLKALRVATLPEPVLAAFQDPRQVTTKHAEALVKALASHSHAEVNRRAAELVAAGRSMPANRVVCHLLGQSTPAASGELKDHGVVLGTWMRDAYGRAVITLEPEMSGTDVIGHLERVLAGLRSRGAVETGFPLQPVAQAALGDMEHVTGSVLTTNPSRSRA